ncbi:MAG: hypothetical protein ACXW3X_14460 [Rhodoplanes sp.]
MLSPPILFFVLRFAAGLLRFDFAMPEGIGKAMSLYLRQPPR